MELKFLLKSNHFQPKALAFLVVITIVSCFVYLGVTSNTSNQLIDLDGDSGQPKAKKTKTEKGNDKRWWYQKNSSAYNSYICGGRRLIFRGKKFCELKIHVGASTILNGINYSTIRYHAIDYFRYYFPNLVTDKSQKVELCQSPTFSAIRFNQMLWLKKKINSTLIAFTVLVKVPKALLQKAIFLHLVS